MGYLLRTGGIMLGPRGARHGGVHRRRLGARRRASAAALRGRLFRRVVTFSDAEVQSAASPSSRAPRTTQRIQMVSVMLLRMVVYAPILAIGGMCHGFVHERVHGDHRGLPWCACSWSSASSWRSPCRSSRSCRSSSTAEPLWRARCSPACRHPRVRPPAFRGGALRRGEHGPHAHAAVHEPRHDVHDAGDDAHHERRVRAHRVGRRQLHRQRQLSRPAT